MLLGITGKMRVGKDTAASYLIEKHGFTRVAFADPLKSLALLVDPIIAEGGLGYLRLSDVIREMGAEGAKSIPEVRRLYQELGNGVRTLQDTFWVDVAAGNIRTLLDEGKRVVVTDVRYPNEANRITALGGEIARITRPGLLADTSHTAHISEVAMEPWFEDFWYNDIENSGSLEDLHIQLDVMVEFMKEEH